VKELLKLTLKEFIAIYLESKEYKRKAKELIESDGEHYYYWYNYFAQDYARYFEEGIPYKK